MTDLELDHPPPPPPPTVNSEAVDTDAVDTETLDRGPSHGFTSAELSVSATEGLVELPTSTGDAPTRHRLRPPKGVERLLGVVLFFAVWELASRLGWIASDVLAGPSTVLTAGTDLIRDGTLIDSLWASLQRVGWGLAIGIPIGTALALISGLSRLGDNLVDANVQMLRFVPIIALQPLLVVWLGVGETVKISLIVLGVAFPIYVNTSSAMKSLDPRYVELANVVSLNRRKLVRRVVLPGALPGFLVGLRLSVAIAWLLLVFAEQINATSGIGFMMIRAQTFFQTDVIVVGLVTYAILGLLSDGIVRALERRLLRWQPGR
ncbi:ABC transporter permease [soil metagenome]